LPTWDKAASNLIIHSSKNDNIENDLGHTNVMSKGQSFILDFRTPKPAVLCSLRAKSWNIEVHKIGHSAGDNDNLSGASPISDGFQSQLVAPNSLYKCKTRFCSPPDFSYHKVIQISYVKLIDDVSHWQQFSMQVLSKKGWFVYLCSFVLREQ